MLLLSRHISIPDNAIELNAIHAQGARGQNVNKVSIAIHLRFDINVSSLPEEFMEKLRPLINRRISSDGVIAIEAQRYRSQEDRDDALAPFAELHMSVMVTRK